MVNHRLRAIITTVISIQRRRHMKIYNYNVDKESMESRPDLHQEEDARSAERWL